jgi:pyruvate dehydrogenase E2 component (dihydrolipoamide acetyltransferase)
MMPRFDPGMQSGKVIRWLKKEGEPVRKGEPLVLVEGEKTTLEMAAPQSGVLRKIIYGDGSDVPVAAVMALLGEPGEPLPEVGAAEPPPVEAAAPAIGEKPAATLEREERRVKASPLARKLAEKHGIDLTTLRGTGPGGRIVREDVLRAVEKKMGKAAPEVKPAAQLEPTGFEVRAPEVAESIPFSGVRKTVAERLSYSFRTTVPATLTMEVDMEHALKLVGTSKEVSVTALLVKAAAKALEDHPILNSSLEGGEVKVFRDINIAVAIHTSEGLTAPVIPNADRKTLVEISQAISHLAEKARSSRLTLEDLTGGTFTVTNLGGYGVEVFIPVINPPHCAILGMGKAVKKPVVENGSLHIKSTAVLSLVFDHRITDGVPAALFLQKVKQLLENPYLLML